MPRYIVTPPVLRCNSLLRHRDSSDMLGSAMSRHQFTEDFCRDNGSYLAWHFCHQALHVAVDQVLYASAIVTCIVVLLRGMSRSSVAETSGLCSSVAA